MTMLSVCGIDVSKDRLDVMVLPEQQRSSASNDPAGWAELIEQLGVGYGFAGGGGRDQMGADFLRVGKPPCAHCGLIGKPPCLGHPGWSATGVSSNTSSFEVPCGHGITSRQRNGPMRSSTPAMSRLGSSP